MCFSVEQDEVKDELNDDEATKKMYINVVDLKSFRGNIDLLSKFIRRGKYNFILMAFCHSFFSKLKHKLEQKGLGTLSYSSMKTIALSCMSVKEAEIIVDKTQKSGIP